MKLTALSAIIIKRVISFNKMKVLGLVAKPYRISNQYIQKLNQSAVRRTIRGS